MPGVTGRKLKWWMGLLGYKENWILKSNLESGIGYGDILVEVSGNRMGIVIEVKYAEIGQEEKECRKALKQIVDKRYTEALHQYGVHKILKYGIACNVKNCRVMMEVSV